MAVWLAGSGDRAIADGDKVATVSQSLTQAMVQTAKFEGKLSSKVTFAETRGVVHRLSVYLNVKAEDPASVKIHLTSPSGTRVLLVDGAKSKAVTKDGIEGWFGTDGLATAQSLAAFSGERATGEWNLTVDGETAGKLVKWSLTTDLSPNTKMAGMETYGEYGGGGGCDCRVANSNAVNGGLALLLLLGLVALRRRS